VVRSDNSVKNIGTDKRFGLVDIDHRWLKVGKTVSKNA
jgi:hypothetical protein